MTKYTENEIAMLDAFYNESIDCCGRCDEEENMSFMNADDLQQVLGGTKQSIGGTMASLLEKGAIADYGDSARGARINDFIIIDFNYKND
jgi:hypothetical protein